MDRVSTAAESMPAPGHTFAHASNSPELRRVLANIRVLVAIVAATEALSLSPETRSHIMLVVLAYAGWAGWLCWAELNGRHAFRSSLTSWVDATWILFFGWIASTQSSLFTLLLLFPVLFASLSFGFVSGLLVSFYSTIAAGAMQIIHGHQEGISATETLLQPLSILVLGPLVAGLAQAGVQMNEQMRIADRLQGQLDPRLGVKRVGETMLSSLARHFSADLGLLLIWLPGSDPRVFRLDRSGKTVELSGELHASVLELLVRLPSDTANVHHQAHFLGRYPIRYHGGFHVVDKAPSGAARPPVQALAESLDARSMISVPICRRGPHPCRLVLESGQRHYRLRDAELLSGVMEQLGPIIENAGLLERLADEAMATERARIGRDLHDTAIQPYLGLKYGIEALVRKAAPDNPLRSDVVALQEVALEELHHLRELVTGMRSGAKGVDDALAPALRRQAKRFSELFGIEVGVRCEGEPAVSRKLAASIFPMVSEALTNIRRHTRATRAEIVVGEDAHRYVIHITNMHDPLSPPPCFIPRSVVERAESVSGCVAVDVQPSGVTDLMISIPKMS
ncbi:sensor histidine kinase [Azoarcus sp. KH32C]|uniref:sensor histidine kinase n=1 Tax=Azoarcus sp. KH32C TaxID=748247 RepID=UPI00023867A1|nr:histidine kinase [Azoarcus sp. KH32C]BAL26399.1 putative two-component system sensor protein [Azoarcus sp. KH32C]